MDPLNICICREWLLSSCQVSSAGIFNKSSNLSHADSGCPVYCKELLGFLHIMTTTVLPLFHKTQR